MVNSKNTLCQCYILFSLLVVSPWHSSAGFGNHETNRFRIVSSVGDSRPSDRERGEREGTRKRKGMA